MKKIDGKNTSRVKAAGKLSGQRGALEMMERFRVFDVKFSAFLICTPFHAGNRPIQFREQWKNINKKLWYSANFPGRVAQTSVNVKPPVFRWATAGLILRHTEYPCHTNTARSDVHKIFPFPLSPWKQVTWPSSLTSDLKTESGPFHRARRQGWWGSLGSPCCFLLTGQRWVPRPWLSMLDLHWPDRPDPWCPLCWSLNCWAVGCGPVERWWMRETVAGHRDFLPAGHGRAARPPPVKSSHSACCHWWRPLRFHTSCYYDPGLTGFGLLLENRKTTSVSSLVLFG